MPEDDRLIFTKQALDLDELLTLLSARGLIVPDKDRATRYLQFIGYFRLIGYAVPFQMGDGGPLRHHFRPDTTFDHILDAYNFDRKPRLLVMDAIERIEVAVRSCISNTLSMKYGPHWFMEPGLFVPPPKFNHQKLLYKVTEVLQS